MFICGLDKNGRFQDGHHDLKHIYKSWILSIMEQIKGCKVRLILKKINVCSVKKTVHCPYTLLDNVVAMLIKI